MCPKLQYKILGYQFSEVQDVLRKERLLMFAGGVVIKLTDHKYYCRETRSAEIRDRFVFHRLVYPGVSFVRTMTGKVTLYFSDISGSKEVSI